MNPALSVIFFTTSSGAGYGMLSVLGIYAVLGVLPRDLWFSLTTMVIALGLITAGLLSSTLHLGHPERALRAFSQWRTSWLSREGVMAVATYLPALAFGVVWIFTGVSTAALGLLAATFAMGTVFTTAMIYRSLRPIHHWHNKYVVPCYLVLGPMTGAVWLLALSALFAQPLPYLAPITLVLLASGLTAKWLYWSFADSTSGPSTPASATGLGSAKSAVQVRSIEWPHTEANYVMKEMGFLVARKHATRLRNIAIWAGFVLPGVMIEASISLPALNQIALWVPAALLMSLGIIAERWLFFAQAKHTVTLYYGAHKA
jgi:DMSO reductase anchor subunit